MHNTTYGFVRKALRAHEIVAGREAKVGWVVRSGDRLNLATKEHRVGLVALAGDEGVGLWALAGPRGTNIAGLADDGHVVREGPGEAAVSA